MHINFNLVTSPALLASYQFMMVTSPALLASYQKNLQKKSTLEAALAGIFSFFLSRKIRYISWRQKTQKN